MNIIRDCRYGKMAFSTNDLYVGRSFDLYGEYSDVEIKFVKNMLKPGWVALDIGANIGALTIPMAQSLGRQGILLAFEPQRISYYGLCTNVFMNNLNNVYCYQRAVGKETGTISLPDLHMTVPGNYGAFSFLKMEEPVYKQCNWLSVDVITIDNLHMGECDFIKIDVEGMELDVLDGAEKTIMAKKPMMYIENDRTENVAAILERLKYYGYNAWQHYPPLYNPDNMKKNQNNVFNNEVSANLVCVPKEKEAEFAKDLPVALKAN